MEEKDISSTRKWYRESFIVRSYVLPAFAPITALLLPLLFQYKLFSSPTRLVIYIVFVGLSAIVLLFFRNMERSEGSIWKEKAEAATLEAKNINLSLKKYTRISSYIGDVVREKSHRFVVNCKEIQKDNVSDPVSIFKEITQPKEQMESLLQQIARFFEAENVGVDVRVNLFRPNTQSNHFEYFLSFPKNRKPLIPESEFKLNVGVAGWAYTHNDLTIIDDIELDIGSHHSKYFIYGEQNRKGCIACYPIHDSQRDCIPFVLSISLDYPNILTENTRNFWKKAFFEQFAERLLLEDRLLYIKENCSRSITKQSNRADI